MGSRPIKAQMIDEIKEDICSSSVAIVTDYRGLTVEEITTLRRSLQEKGAEYTVVKNTLAKIAIKDTKFEGLSQFLEGPTAMVLGKKDQVGPAKALTQFMKKAKKVTIRGGVLDGSVLTETNVKQLADMPSIEELYAKMLGSLNAPASGIVTCTSGVARALVVCIDQIRKQKEEQQ